MSYSGWKPYVPVAERRAKAAKMAAKLQKKGLTTQPVAIAPRRPIAATFWGKAWCNHMESFRDYDNRLPRGRTYVRNGSVCHLEVQAGKIEAMVSGSSLYKVEIAVKKLPAKKWRAIGAACSGKIGSLLDLLRGRLASGLMEVVCHRTTGLFPLQGEISFQCDCPDWATMCKHVAAVLYGVGSRLDQAPEQLFLLRGVDQAELVDIPTAVASVTRQSGLSSKRIEAENLGDVFGIELAAEGKPATAAHPGQTVAIAGKEKPAPTANISARTRKKQPPKRPFSATTTSRSPQVGQEPERLGKQVPVAASSAAPVPFPQRLTGPALRRWREACGLTQAVLATRLGVTASSISQWENKGRKVLRLRPEILAILLANWESGMKLKS